MEAILVALVPNTEYRARISASNTGGTGYSPSSTFTTPPAKPEISEAPAADVSETAATLAANVNPRNSSFTDCHFVYGPTTAYGQQAPCASPPSGNSERLVTARVEGLSPGSTYHFKLIAANSAGSAEGPDTTFVTAAAGPGPTAPCANEAIRAQQGSQSLPSCRAYEMVSPADKSGGTIMNPPTLAPGQTVMEIVAPDGEGALFWAYQGMGDAQGAYINSYWATRTAGGWTSTSLVPEFPRPVRNTIGNKSQILGASPDLSRFFIRTPSPSTRSTSARPVSSRPGDVYAVSPGGDATWISRPDGTTTAATKSFNSVWVGSSANGQRVFFQSEEGLVPAAAERVASTTSTNGTAIGPVWWRRRERRASERMRGRSSAPTVAAPYELYGHSDGAKSTLQGAVSPSADRVYFTSPDPAAVVAAPPTARRPGPRSTCATAVTWSRCRARAGPSTPTPTRRPPSSRAARRTVRSSTSPPTRR